MSTTYNMAIVGSSSAIVATLNVTVSNGTATSVIASNGTKSAALVYDSVSDVWSVNLDSAGTWTVYATDGVRTVSQTVNVDEIGVYDISIAVPNVPLGYTQLEWISSTGAEWTGAYIDTGYQPVSSCRLFGKVQLLRTSGYPRFFIAEKYDSPKAAIATNVVNNKLAYYNGANYSGSSEVSVGDVISVSTGVDYSYSTSGRSITVNGTTKSVSSGSAVTSPTVNMYIAWPGTKTYYFQMTDTDGSTLVRDMVPAKRQSDNEVGMWDKVNNVFYTSVTNSKFTAGPEIN